MKMTGERFIPSRMQALAEIEHMHRYHSVKKLLQDKVVLDAACGTGYGTNIMSEVANTVYGLDISNEALQYAEDHYGNNKISYIQGSIEKLEFPDNFFDVVVSFETIEHVDEELQLKFLKEISRVLKEDGILIMSTPDKKIYTDQQSGVQTEWHIKEFYADEFEQFIRNQFSNIKWYNQYMCECSYIVNAQEYKIDKINFRDDKEGKFIIVIASNKPIHDSLSIGSSYYCGEEYSGLDDYIQVYFSKSNEEFTEQRYQMKEISRKNKDIKARIWLDNETAKDIRIDPLSVSCEILIKSINIFQENGEKIEVTEFATNADMIENNKFIFLHNDPQIIVSMKKELVIDFIEVEYFIVAYNLDVYKYYNLLQQSKIDELIKLNKEISEYRDLLLFEQGKNCTLNEVSNQKEIRIRDLAEENKELYIKLDRTVESMKTCETELVEIKNDAKVLRSNKINVYKNKVIDIFSRIRKD